MGLPMLFPFSHGFPMVFPPFLDQPFSISSQLNLAHPPSFVGQAAQCLEQSSPASASALGKRYHTSQPKKNMVHTGKMGVKIVLFNVVVDLVDNFALHG